MALAALQYRKPDARKNHRDEVRIIKSGINGLPDAQTRRYSSQRCDRPTRYRSATISCGKKARVDMLRRDEVS
jgi:hypothetical protein